MDKLVFATKNNNKLTEVSHMLENSGITIVGVEGDFNPVESGETFEENAYIKAFEAAKIMKVPALADDSGLVVDALGGRPGVHSSRYAENDRLRIEKLLAELQDVEEENRTARFVCSMVIVSPLGEKLFACTETCEGQIANSPKGDSGFGYDPVFYIPKKNQTMAELPMGEKNKLSHRGKALRKVMEWLSSNKIAV